AIAKTPISELLRRLTMPTTRPCLIMAVLLTCSTSATMTSVTRASDGWEAATTTVVNYPVTTAYYPQTVYYPPATTTYYAAPVVASPTTTYYAPQTPVYTERKYWVAKPVYETSEREEQITV